MQEYKYTVKEKKTTKYITDGLEIPSDENSDEKYSDEKNYSKKYSTEENYCKEQIKYHDRDFLKGKFAFASF